MPKKWKKYQHTKFSPETIRRAAASIGVLPHALEVQAADDTVWTFSSIEEVDECFSMYRSKDCAEATLTFYPDKSADRLLNVFFSQHRTSISIRMEKRSDVEAAFHIFEGDLANSRIPVNEIDGARNASLNIFIGHGRSEIWRDLKDHLADKHGYNVIAFETDARGGRPISDILEDLEEDASFAIMVMTGENKSAAGTLHARENVIHETGLFQGVLGLQKVLVLLERGCEEFSNRAGVQYLPFAKGNIKEVFGEVLATIRREFGQRS